jgi:hypothetical protein
MKGKRSTKICQETSNLPFAVPGNVKLKLPNKVVRIDQGTTPVKGWKISSV